MTLKICIIYCFTNEAINEVLKNVGKGEQYAIKRKVETEKAKSKINNTHEKILEELEAYPRINRETLALHLNISESTVFRELKEMQEIGLIKRVGSKKTGYREIQ